MQHHKDLLIEARNAERHENLRKTFSKINSEEEVASKIVVDEQDAQKKALHDKLKARGRKIPEKPAVEQSAIIDDYSGIDMDLKSKPSHNELDERKVIDDDFLADLKQVDVPDSDDEVYF